MGNFIRGFKEALNDKTSLTYRWVLPLLYAHIVILGFVFTIFVLYLMKTFLSPEFCGVLVLIGFLIFWIKNIRGDFD